jgi:hypothetical protein
LRSTTQWHSAMIFPWGRSRRLERQSIARIARRERHSIVRLKHVHW